MILASVFFPDPGGPKKMHEPISPRRISSPRGFPGASRCSWPRNSSKVPGRILAAKGSPNRWNRVGSDTGGALPGCGMRDAGCVKTALRCRNRVVSPPSAQPRFTDVRKLERLDAWRTAQELDRKSTRLNSSHSQISYAVFCLKKKKNNTLALTAITLLHTFNYLRRDPS